MYDISLCYLTYLCLSPNLWRGVTINFPVDIASDITEHARLYKLIAAYYVRYLAVVASSRNERNSYI